MQAAVVPRRVRSECMPVVLSRERRRIEAPIAWGNPLYMRKETFAYTQGNFRIYMKEKTKCSGVVGRMWIEVNKLRVQGWENELR